jgi:NitT/TauT family transport system substrate-binding protein
MKRSPDRGPRRARLRPTLGVAALLVAATVTLAACGSSSPSKSSDSGSAKGMTKVSIGVNAAVAGEIEPQLAKDAGLFAKYGIDATVTVIPASNLLAALSSGKVQFGAFGAPQPEEAAMSNAPLKWLGVWEGKPNTQLIVGPGINSIAELKGKSMGITVPGSLIDLFSRQILKDNNVDADGVKFQALQSTTAALSAFIGGSIQATILSPPQSTRAMTRKGAKSLLDVGSKYDWPQGGLVGYTPWVTSHAAATTNVLKAVSAAVNLYRSDPAKAKAAIKELAPTTSTADLDASYQSALSTLVTGNIEPSLKTEQFVFSALADLFPDKYPKADPALASKYIDSSYAKAAAKEVPITG